MLNVKELFESLSDAEKEELKKLLLHHTDEVKVQSPKEDTFCLLYTSPSPRDQA